jgi:hypothetical protein
MHARYAGLNNWRASLSALRAFRVLRVVRFAELVPQLRLVVYTLYYAVPALAAIAVMLAVFLITFVVVGQALYEGDLDSGCFALSNGTTPTLTQVGVRACGSAPSAYHCRPAEQCIPRRDLPSGVVLVTPFDGVYGFDNAGIGM